MARDRKDKQGRMEAVSALGELEGQAGGELSHH